MYWDFYFELFAAVHCDPVSVSGPHLTVRVEGTRLGHTAIFQCPIGFKVDGAANLTCQASGKSCLICITVVYSRSLQFLQYSPKLQMWNVMLMWIKSDIDRSFIEKNYTMFFLKS